MVKVSNRIRKLTPLQRLLQQSLIRVRPAPLAVRLKKLLGIRRIEFVATEGVFWIDPVSLLGIALTTHGEFEPGLSQVIKSNLGPGDVFVDLGANEGYFSVLAAGLCGREGRVLSIEPQHRLLPVIDYNFKLNQIENAQILNVAIGDTIGDCEIFLTPDTLSGGSGLHSHSKYSLPKQPVKMTTLENALDEAGLDSVDLMKVDIEGFEYEAILSSTSLFQSKRIKKVSLEIHSSILTGRGKDPMDLTRFMMDCGYHQDVATGSGLWITG